jgi:hypothetical protein
VICQRCGLCCVSMGVIINLKGKAVHKPGDARCPHLSFEGTTAKCAVHDQQFFKESPCHTYGNGVIDPDFYHKRGKPCPIGELIQSKGGLFAVHGEKYGRVLNADDLRDFGPWPEEEP